MDFFRTTDCLREVWVKQTGQTTIKYGIPLGMPYFAYQLSFCLLIFWVGFADVFIIKLSYAAFPAK